MSMQPSHNYLKSGNFFPRQTYISLINTISLFDTFDSECRLLILYNFRNNIITFVTSLQLHSEKNTCYANSINVVWGSISQMAFACRVERVLGMNETSCFNFNFIKCRRRIFNLWRDNLHLHLTHCHTISRMTNCVV